jgi:hypothetical protein
MTLTISQYLEALGSPDGRTRTLEMLRTVNDDSGAVMFSVPGHGLVDFEVIAGFERHTLRCPLAEGDLRALAKKDQGLRSKYFSEWRLLEKEMVLFDNDGVPFEVDILARKATEGEPLVEYLDRASVRGDISAIKAMSRDVEKLFAWAHDINRGVAMDKVLVATDGSLKLKSFSAADDTERIRRMLRSIASTQKPGEPEIIRLVRDGGGWMYVDRIGRAVIDDVWRTAEPFRGGRAEVGTPEGLGLIDTRGRRVIEPIYEELVWDDYWGLATVMREGRWSLIDSDGKVLTEVSYDWLGECSDGMVLAQRDGKCGFVDMRGREAVACMFDDASSFAEGAALVTLDGEEFFIDSRGELL